MRITKNYAKQVVENQDVAPVDSTENLITRDVLGNKEDTGALTKDTSSLLALSRKGAKEAWEVEHHFHTRERFLGLAGAAEAYAPYAIPVGDAGIFGAWTAVLDADDTPIISGSTHYDPHLVLITSTPLDNKIAILQLAWGAVAATAYSDGDYTETMFLIEKGVGGAVNVVPVGINCKRLPTDTLLWARAKQDTADATDGTVDFFIGIHEYTDPDT